MSSSKLEENASRPNVLKVSRILLVEDDVLLQEMLILVLRKEGYEVVATSGETDALELLYPFKPSQEKLSFDLIILDLMQPQFDGLDLCCLLRSKGNSVPILVLSPKGEEADIVSGLEAGADDYLVKPFGLREFSARCRALFRRTRLGNLTKPAVLKFKKIHLYTHECRVTACGNEVHLSPREFQLLELMMNFPFRVWSREQLLRGIWGPDPIGSTRTVDVHIGWLREKLELDPKQPKYISTVRGVGYRFG